jgi:hypothetical protein
MTPIILCMFQVYESFVNKILRPSLFVVKVHNWSQKMVSTSPRDNQSHFVLFCIFGIRPRFRNCIVPYMNFSPKIERRRWVKRQDISLDRKCHRKDNRYLDIPVGAKRKGWVQRIPELRIDLHRSVVVLLL